MIERTIATSVLVIGTGGAGLRAAIELRRQGTDITAVGKRRKSDACTTLAAGGINAALGTMDPEDSWQQHAADTIKESYDLGAGCGHSRGDRPADLVCRRLGHRKARRIDRGKAK